MLRVGDQVELVTTRPAPYRRGWVDMRWERADDQLLGRVGRITSIDPDGTFQLDIDPRGGWFAPTWIAAGSSLRVGDQVELVTTRPAPYRRGWVDMRWERADDQLLGRVGRITSIDPDGTFQLDIDPRGGWFAPTWVTPAVAESVHGGGGQTPGTDPGGTIPSTRILRDRPVVDEGFSGPCVGADATARTQASPYKRAIQTLGFILVGVAALLYLVTFEGSPGDRWSSVLFFVGVAVVGLSRI